MEIKIAVHRQCMWLNGDMRECIVYNITDDVHLARIEEKGTQWKDTARALVCTMEVYRA